jgi:NADH-quinone oxidoreductase subunit E
MSHLRPEYRQRAEEIVALYPHRRSATLPLCHLAQEQDGFLTAPAMVEIGELTGTTPAEVRGTASFYDMFHLEPVGEFVVGICTNIACMLAGGLELLAHAERRLGVPVGATTADGKFTLEELECLGDCSVAPCVQVNHRFVRTTTPESFDTLIDDVGQGRRGEEIPRHGVLSRVGRTVGLLAPHEVVQEERTRVRIATTSEQGSAS